MIESRGRVMDSVLVSCRGVQVGSIYVPPFELHAGELLCLHLPGPPSGDDKLVDVLAGAQPIPEIRFSAHVELAHIPPARRGLLGLFGRRRALNWFRRTTGTSRAEALAVMQRLGIDSDRHVDVGALAMNPRTLLALETAFARGAEVVVFLDCRL
jgi:hypothetical protein